MLDLRQNHGGNPRLVASVLGALWDESIPRHLDECTQFTYNLEPTYLRQFTQQYIAPIVHHNDTPEDVRRAYKRHIRAMNRLSKHYATLSSQSVNSKSCKRGSLQTTIRQLKNKLLESPDKYKKVCVITDYHCYSACVWSVRVLTQLPNVLVLGKQVGSTTGSGNSIKFPLPSNLGHIVSPQLTFHFSNSLSDVLPDAHTDPDVLLPDAVLASTDSIVLWIAEHKTLLNQLFTRKLNAKY